MNESRYCNDWFVSFLEYKQGISLGWASLYRIAYDLARSPNCCFNSLNIEAIKCNRTSIRSYSLYHLICIDRVNTAAILSSALRETDLILRYTWNAVNVDLA